MKQIFRLLSIIALVFIGAGQTWASIQNNPRVTFAYENEHGTAIASEADGNGKVTITITPEDGYRCIDGDVTAEVVVSSSQAGVRTRTSINYGEIIDVTCTKTNEFTLTMPADEAEEVLVTVRFSEKVPLTVTAKDHSIFYGNAAANNGVVYDGFVNGEGENVLEGELTYSYTNNKGNFREDNNAPGEYDIIPSGLTSANYAITFVPGTLTVKPVIVKFIVDIANGEPLAGIHVIVRRKTDNNIIHEWNSTTENHEINVLKAGGEYSIVGNENNDYTSSADYTLTIDENGNVSYSGTITEGGVLLIENAKKVKVSVVDIADGEEIEGAHVQVIDSEGKVVKEWTSDTESLVHVITGLNTGEVYTLRETIAPEGYTIPTDFTFTIGTNGVITTTGTKTEDGVLLIQNSKTHVKVSVVDIADGKELEGATVQVIDSEGNVVKEWDSDTESLVHVIEGLKTGEVYTLHETVAPDGYTVATDITFTIGTNGTITFSGNTTTDENGLTVLLVENSKTQVKISVVDIADGAKIAGAHVQVIDSEGNVVEEWDSTTLPHVIEGLATGEEYTLKETVAPDGYVLSAESTFTIDASGGITFSGTKTTDENGLTVLLVENSKTQVKISVVDIADGKELEGATVQVIDSKGSIVDEWVSTTEPHVIEGLKTGEEYTLHETAAPVGYTIPDDFTFTIGTNGSITTTGTKTEDGVLLIENNKTKVPYIDADGNPADCTDYTEIDGSETSFGPGWYVVNGNISLPMYGSLAFCSSTAGAVHLIIADGASLTINAMGEGIKIGENSSLTIYGQANSTGTINVSSDAALAISAATGGSLTINGGSVTASGNNAGFSIGGNVCINSGTVTATANNASGISASGNITINGGSVTASGYNNGINASCNITINGGSVTAKSSNCCINATGSITLNDGTIEATDVNNSGINATGGITLGGAIVTAKDYIGTVTIADGKAYTDGTNNYFGTLTNEEKAAIANVPLHPVTGVTLTKDVSGEITASLDPSSEEEVSIPVAVEVDHVEVDRTYESDKASTVYLPFSIPVTNVSGGKFHTFTRVDESTDPWTVKYTEVASGDIAANTPYIFLPDGTNEGKIVVNNSAKVSVSTANPKTTTQGLWEFIGTYERIKWTHDTTDPEYTAAREAEIGSVYGFAANDSGTDHVGDFVKVGNNVWINPMRAYLKRSTSPGARTMTSDGQAQQLPDKMRVVIISASGETNEIGTLDTRTGEISLDEWYSLDGHKLNGKPTKKGVYIKNGNKVVIKN